MPRLYLNMIEATDNQITLGAPVGMVLQGTAAEVTATCEALTRAVKKLGFKKGGPA